MSEIVDDWAQEAADAILENLSGRKGVGDELGALENGDEEIWQEIRAEVAEIIRSKKPEPEPPPEPEPD